MDLSLDAQTPFPDSSLFWSLGPLLLSVLFKTLSPCFPSLISPQISDHLRRNWPPSFLSEFRALQFSLMLCAFVGALGGAAFLGTAIVIEGDRRRAQLHVQGQLDLPSIRAQLLAQLHDVACLFFHPSV